MSIDISISGIEKVLEKLNPEKYRFLMAKYLEASAELVASVSAALAPRRTGRLSSSIKVSRRDELLYEVVSEAPYTLYVEKGVKPFTLQRSVLINGAGWRFIKIHPGIKPSGFISRAIDTWKENKDKILNNQLKIL